MKGILFSFVLMALSLDGLSAQEFHFTLHAGPAYSWMSANKNTIKRFDTRFAFKAHLQAEYWFNPKMAFVGGLGFSLGQGGALEFKKGGDVVKEAELSEPIYHDLPAGTRIVYRMNYLDLPFGLKLRTNEFKGYRYHLVAPEVILSMRTKARGDIAASGLPFTKDEDLRGAMQFFVLFYGIYAGLEKTLSEDLSLVGGIRFSQSFTDITKDSGQYSDGSKENSKGILSSLDFRIGVIF